jgi:CRISPR-associated protein Cmr2
MVDTQSETLLVFSLGPVQSFISTARRTQDLWMGSKLLSGLAAVGIREAEKHLDDAKHFVYPTKIDGRWPEDIPNRFVLLVPPGQGSAIGEHIEQAVQSAWLHVSAEVRDAFFARLVERGGWKSLWERQVTDWLETYWIAYGGSPEDYGQRYRDAGLALASRKSIRYFPQGPESGEKCTLCGVREALHGGQGSRRELREFWEGLRQRLARLNIFSLREGEHLCAVCTVKRFAGEAGIKLAGQSLKPGDRFPSTSSIAVSTFKTCLLKNWDALREVTEQHLDALAALDAQSGAPFGQPESFPHLQDLAGGSSEAERLMYYEGDYFYHETLRSDNLYDVLGREPEPRDQQLAGKAQATLSHLIEAMHDLELPSPHPYLAVLALDGDHMGALLSWCETPEEHRRISEALVRYARITVPEIVESRYAGRVIYAGGDDVLALLPVGHVLQAANDLRRELTEALKGADIDGQTASAGVAIIHHGHALENGLQSARRAEYRAKETYGRNALVVDLIRRSGERVEVGLHWDYGSQIPSALSSVLTVQNALTDQRLSGRFVYELREEAPALAGVYRSQESEIRRLLTRHWLRVRQPDNREQIDEEVTALARDLAALARVGGGGIEALAEWMLVARFFAQGGEDV